MCSSRKVRRGVKPKRECEVHASASKSPNYAAKKTRAILVSAITEALALSSEVRVLAAGDGIALVETPEGYMIVRL